MALQTAHGDDLLTSCLHSLDIGLVTLDIGDVTLLQLHLGNFLLAVVLRVLLLDVRFGFKFTRLLLVLPAVPLDLHAVVDSVLVSRHVLHVGKPLPTEVAGEVPDPEVDSHAVSVEIKLPFEFLTAVCRRENVDRNIKRDLTEDSPGQGHSGSSV